MKRSCGGFAPWYWLLVLSTALAACAPPDVDASKRDASPRIHAVIVGADKYQTMDPLYGAENDAHALTRLFNDLGAASVTTLIGSDVTRASVLSALETARSEAAPGDTLVFTYAGHSGPAPDGSTARSEADGVDETLFLPGYGGDRDHNGERIRDDEIFDWIERASAQEVVVLFDSCHSATLSRKAVGSPVLGALRTGVVEPLEDDDALPALSPEDTSDQLAASNEYYLGATQDSLGVHEVLVNGESRGALSVAFERGLRGGADASKDGLVTRRELNHFVNVWVKHLNSQQTPKLRSSGDSDRAAIPGAGRLEASQLLSPKSTKLPVYFGPGIGAEQRKHAEAAVDQAGGHLVTTPTQARLEVNYTDDEFVVYFTSNSKDVACRTDADGLAPEIARWALVEQYAGEFSRRPVPIDDSTGAWAKTHFIPDQVTLNWGYSEHFADPDSAPYVLLFNIACGGVLQKMYPGKKPASSDDWPGRGQSVFSWPIGEPVGTDLVIISTSRQVQEYERLFSVVSSGANKPGAEPVKPGAVRVADLQVTMDGLAHLVRSNKARVSVLHVFTAERP